MLTAALDVSHEIQPGNQESTPVGDVDFQHLLAIAHEKQRLQLQEVSVRVDSIGMLSVSFVV